MLSHSFVLDALPDTAGDTFSHFEMLIEEHRKMEASADPSAPPSRLKQLVPTIGSFHTNLPLREAFLFYNAKHRLTARKHIQISFNEIRHILNMAQIMALREPKTAPSEADTNAAADADDDEDSLLEDSKSTADDGNDPLEFNGPKLITFDGDQTLYSDGTNFDSNPRLANYLYKLLKNGVNIAVVTAAGYEYNVEKYEFRLSGLLAYFKSKGLTKEECDRFYLFGGECNYLMKLGHDYKLKAIKENGPGGWFTATRHLPEAPGNWDEADVQNLLDIAENSFNQSIKNLNIRGRVIKKRRAVGLVPKPNMLIPREALDETVLSLQDQLGRMSSARGVNLPRCIFNGGTDCWCDSGNKRVGVLMLQSYLGVQAVKTLHIGDQFLNTGNDYAARDVCPCIWITSPEETTYILKSILRLAGLGVATEQENALAIPKQDELKRNLPVDFSEIERRSKAVKVMDVYTGEMITKET